MTSRDRDSVRLSVVVINYDGIETLPGTIASLPTVQERGEYQELPIGDNKETSSWEYLRGWGWFAVSIVVAWIFMVVA